MRFPVVLFAGSRATLAPGIVGVVAAVGLALGACGRGAAAPHPAAAGGAPDLALAAAGGSSALPEVTAERGRYISLLYSSNLQGEYEHCGCPSHPIGGLARRATIVDRARTEADAVLVVDAGDLLLPAVFHSDTLRPPDAGEVERRARLLLGALGRMGVQAFLPAERDLAIGPARLRRMAAALQVPVVAANLVDRAGKPLFQRDRLLTLGGVRVGIFGVVAPQPEDQALWDGWAITARDPAATAREEVASLKGRGAEMIVALLHLGPTGAARKLLEVVPGIHWAVQGHAAMQIETPENNGGARLVEAMMMGRLAGRLDIHVVAGTDTFADRGERAQVLTIAADHRRQLADLQRRADEDKTDQLREYYKLRREGLTAAIAKETALGARLPRTLAGSWYENRIIPLDESIPDHPAIAALVTAYNAENARRALAGRPVGIAMLPKGAPPSAQKAAASPAGAAVEAPPRYAGSGACASCHAEAFTLFRNTKHARALRTLAATHRDHDPTCVSCHSTAWAAAGGTTDVRVATTRLKDVGCESCHGPGLDHVTAGGKIAERTGPGPGLRRQVSEMVCRGCHTPDQTNGEFDFRSFRRAILGPGHGEPRGG